MPSVVESYGWRTGLVVRDVVDGLGRKVLMKVHFVGMMKNNGVGEW